MAMLSVAERAPDYLCMDDVDEDVVTLEDDASCSGSGGTTWVGLEVRLSCVTP